MGIKAMESLYTRDNFPHFIGRHGAWNIYANAAGQCAAIPRNPAAGHKPSHFGEAWQARRAIAESTAARAFAAMRRYRQNCFDSDAAARAIQRLKRAPVWAAAIAHDRGKRESWPKATAATWGY